GLLQRREPSPDQRERGGLGEQSVRDGAAQAAAAAGDYDASGHAGCLRAPAPAAQVGARTSRPWPAQEATGSPAARQPAKPPATAASRGPALAASRPARSPSSSRSSTRAVSDSRSHTPSSRRSTTATDRPA